MEEAWRFGGGGGGGGGGRVVQFEWDFGHGGGSSWWTLGLVVMRWGFGFVVIVVDDVEEDVMTRDGLLEGMREQKNGV